MKNYRLLCYALSVFFITATSTFFISPSTLFAESVEPLPVPTVTLPDFVELAKRLTPVTVNISTTKTIKPRYNEFGSPHGQQQNPHDPFRDFFGDDFYRRFFGDMPKEYKQKSLGSGFIIDKEGYILTNNHVVEGVDEIKVKTHNQKEYNADVIGRDPKTDVALIKIKGLKGPLPVAVLGNSSELQVGEWVLAIGNPFGLQETVTAGIVSAQSRKIGAGPYDNFIQTDASINPGNSGGPLFNTKGEVVGINTLIYSPSGGNVGIGFATSINLAKNVITQLKDNGRVVRGWLGVIVQTVTPELAESFDLDEGKGALIADTVKNGPAAKAGIKQGDVIIKFNNKDINEMADLPIMVADTPVGKKIKMVVIRGGKKRELSVEIGELKDEKPLNQEKKEKINGGMTVTTITPELADRLDLSDSNGVIISNVNPGSPADDAGLMKGDIIKEINRKPINSIDEYMNAMNNKKNSNMLVLVKRGRTSLWVVLKIEKK